MEEKDLQGLWNRNGEKATDYYSGIEKQVLNKAKAQSHDILDRVRKNIIIELVASAIVTIGFPFMLLHNMIIFCLGTVVMLVAMGATLKVYLGYLNDIKQVSEVNVIAGLKKKIKVLAGYIRRVMVMVYIFAPIGFFLGLAMTAADHDFTFNEEFGFRDILLQTVIGIPFLALVFWGFKKYIYWLYGKHLNRLRNVLEGLEE